MRVLFILFTLVLMQATANAQKRVDYDSSTLDTRVFNAEKMNTYRASKDFQYQKNAEPEQSLWDRFWARFWYKIDQWVERFFSSKGGVSGFKIAITIIAVGLIVFAILKMTGMTKAGLFGRNVGKGLDYTTSQENIHNIAFEEAIQEAINNGNLRLAVRLLYLQTLKKLSDHELINWQINKTNIAYLQELQGSPYHAAFSNLTLQFESNWYGDIPIGNPEFKEVMELFNQFNRQLV